LIVIVGAVVLVLLAMVVGFIFSSKYAERISRVFSDLNPFKPERDPGDGGELGTPSSLNETENESEVSGGGGGGSGVSTEVTYGTGKLRIVNYVSDINLDKGSFNVVHYTDGTEGYGTYDRGYSGFFSPSGKSTKIISRISGYELLNDVRPLTSLSTIYLDLR